MDPGDDILVRVAGTIALQQFDLHVIERIEIGPTPLCSRAVRPGRRISSRSGMASPFLSFAQLGDRCQLLVMPAKAGIQGQCSECCPGLPLFAGVTISH
jgi:hypothetical protein